MSAVQVAPPPSFEALYPLEPVVSSTSLLPTLLHTQQQGWHLDFLDADDTYVCVICTLVCRDAVETSCSHIFCKSCLSDWLTISSSDSCPVCRASLLASYKAGLDAAAATADMARFDVHASTFVRRHIFNLRVSCPNACGTNCELHALEHHLKQCAVQRAIAAVRAFVTPKRVQSTKQCITHDYHALASMLHAFLVKHFTHTSQFLRLLYHVSQPYIYHEIESGEQDENAKLPLLIYGITHRNSAAIAAASKRPTTLSSDTASHLSLIPHVCTAKCMVPFDFHARCNTHQIRQQAVVAILACHRRLHDKYYARFRELHAWHSSELTQGVDVELLKGREKHEIVNMRIDDELLQQINTFNRKYNHNNQQQHGTSSRRGTAPNHHAHQQQHTHTMYHGGSSANRPTTHISWHMSMNDHHHASFPNQIFHNSVQHTHHHNPSSAAQSSSSSSSSSSMPSSSHVLLSLNLPPELSPLLRPLLFHQLTHGEIHQHATAWIEMKQEEARRGGSHQQQAPQARSRGHPAHGSSSASAADASSETTGDAAPPAARTLRTVLTHTSSAAVHPYHPSHESNSPHSMSSMSNSPSNNQHVIIQSKTTKQCCILQ